MKKFLLMCFSFGFAISVWAQDRVVTGRVTSAEDGTALPGVNVLVKGTTNGTVTDSDGKYSLSVPSTGASLVFSFIGLKTEEIPVESRSVVDVQLAQDVSQLSEVVVTALNIKQDVKTLSYATQQVNADKLILARANNVTDALAGKVAGVQTLSQAGSKLGANTVVRIRGAGSLNDGAPLYILDGTPIANNQQDINPDDIESVNVLKGPQAVALYGQRGEFGVIVMTTKKAKKGQLGVEITNNTMAENVYILPKYQNSYAGGTSPDLAKFTYQPGMPSEWQSLNGKYYPDYMDDSSWGPRMVGQEYIPWYAWTPGTQYTGKTAKLVPQPNNVRNFYNTGVNSITNISLGKAEDNYSVRFSYTNQNQTGVTPFTNLQKNTFSTQASVNLAKWITVGANISYVTQHAHGDFDDGYANQTTGSFNSWFHRDLDMNIMKQMAFVTTPNGTLTSWNHFDPSYWGTKSASTQDQFLRGYYWWNHYAYSGLVQNNSDRNNLFGDVNVTLNISKKFSAKAYYQKNEFTTNATAITPTSLAKSFDNELRLDHYDSYAVALNTQKEDNIMGIVTYNDKVANDQLSINVNVGGNLRYEKQTTFGANTYAKAFLVIPDLYTLSNTGGQLTYSNLRYRKEVQSVYASGSFGYRDYLFLSWSARNDWSSALPKGNNSYFYPSVGLGFVFSELMNGSIPALSFGKLRANIAQVGSDLGPYNTSIYYGLGLNKWNGNSTSNVPDQQIDPRIKPSLSTNYEFGLDLKFLQNRISVSGSYYHNDRKNQILAIPISPASGFTTLVTNVGESTSQGVELAISATAIKTDNFSWEVSLNAAHNTSKVVTVAPGITQIYGGANTVSFGGPFGVQLYHVAGQKWGQLRGFGIKRDASGNPVILNGNQYDYDSNHNFGSVLPDFTGGLQNYFTYKNFKLQINIDFQSGGKYFSLSDMWGSYSGLTARTAGVNDKGVPVRNPVSDGGGVHLKGVDGDGNKVDTYVDAKTYWDVTLGGNGVVDQSIYDMTYVKLREVNLGYNIPVSKLGSFSKVFKTASISFIGRNLWLIYAQNRNFDPSVMSLTVGENGQLFGTRSYGASIKLGF